MLDVQSVDVSIAGRRIIDDLSFSARAGDSIAITGPSGCGKTTLLNVLGRLLPAASGRIIISPPGTGAHSRAASDATGWSSSQIRSFWREHAAFILQDAGLNDDWSVIDNVLLKKPLFGKNRVSREVSDILARVGLADRSHAPVLQLSGGERRRVAIARAIYRRAHVIFADEPTASLDEASRTVVQELLLAEAERGAIVLISTHDEELATACTKRVQLQRVVDSNNPAPGMESRRRRV